MSYHYNGISVEEFIVNKSEIGGIKTEGSLKTVRIRFFTFSIPIHKLLKATTFRERQKFFKTVTICSALLKKKKNTFNAVISFLVFSVSQNKLNGSSRMKCS